MEEGLARKRPGDRFEREGEAFHQRVRDGYLEMAKKEPERWLVVDAALPRQQVTQIIWGRVSNILSERGLTPGAAL